MNGYSPSLALVTGVFEVVVAVWAFSSRGRRHILVPAGLILWFLAGYQFAEVWVCANPANTTAARLAFVDIVWLPPLGMWLVLRLSGRVRSWLGYAILGYFAAAGVLSVWIFVEQDFVVKSVCEVVIAWHDNPTVLYDVYCAFYQFGLAAMLFGAALGLACTDDGVLRRHLVDVQMGTLGFVLPAMLVRISLSGLEGAVPSIMCHFALVLAVFLTRLILRERRFASVKG